MKRLIRAVVGGSTTARSRLHGRGRDRDRVEPKRFGADRDGADLPLPMVSDSGSVSDLLGADATSQNRSLSARTFSM